jgi:hypothetical protein
MNMHATIELPFLCNGEVNRYKEEELLGNWVFSGTSPRLYDEDLRRQLGSN